MALFLPRGFLSADVRRVLRHYWRVADARPVQILIPFGLALLATGVDGASFALLIPLSEALSQNSFEFLANSPYFGWIVALMPDSALSSPARDAYVALTLMGLVVLGRVGKVTLDYVQRVYIHRREETHLAKVQEHTFARVLQFGRQYFDRQSLGKVDVEIGWSRSVVDLLANVERLLYRVLNFVTKTALMVILSVPLSVTVLIAFPAIQFVVRRINHAVERLAHQGADVERRIRSQVLDLLASVPLVKAYNQEEQASTTYGEILGEARGLAMRRRNMMALRWPVEEILILGTVLAAQGVIMLTSPGFRPGDLARLAAFLLLFQQLLPDLKAFGTFGLGFSEQIPKLQALAGLLSDEDKYVVSSGDRTFRSLTHGIEVDDLSFRYRDGPTVLQAVTARIPAGEITAVVGSSGSGKTTFVDLVARFYECPPRTILADGRDIRDFTLASIYSRMAIVSQEAWMLNRSLRDNLIYGLDEPPRDAELLELLDEFQFGDFLSEHAAPLDLIVGDRGVQLSGGQRQRIAIARALLRDPEIMILDEATSALDSVVESRVAEAIERRLRGRTLLVVAHRLSTIRGADQILVFEQGRIVERGRWEDLLARNGEFTRLHEAQFEQRVAAG
jgi:ATP-binding cassette, subfamily B, bacterial MsbA